MERAEYTGQCRSREAQSTVQRRGSRQADKESVRKQTRMQAHSRCPHICTYSCAVCCSKAFIRRHKEWHCKGRAHARSSCTPTSPHRPAHTPCGAGIPKRCDCCDLERGRTPPDTCDLGTRAAHGAALLHCANGWVRGLGCRMSICEGMFGTGNASRHIAAQKHGFDCNIAMMVFGQHLALAAQTSAGTVLGAHRLLARVH